MSRPLPMDTDQHPQPDTPLAALTLATADRPTDLPPVPWADPNAPLAGVEVADWLRVSPLTVASWRQRGVIPAPRWIVAGRKQLALWTRADLEPWARATGRL